MTPAQVLGRSFAATRQFDDSVTEDHDLLVFLLVVKVVPFSEYAGQIYGGARDEVVDNRLKHFHALSGMVVKAIDGVTKKRRCHTGDNALRQLAGQSPVGECGSIWFSVI